jgi:predicted dehydrogenase
MAEAAGSLHTAIGLQGRLNPSVRRAAEIIAEGRWPQVKLVDTGAISVREVPDHLDAIAKTSSGAPVGVQILAGVPASDAHFSLEVRGSEGWLKLTGDHPAGVQVGDLTLSSSVDFTAPDRPVATGAGPTAANIWTGASINVGEVYAGLARDITNGTHHTPGFQHAAHNGRLIARVEQAARTGVRH